jgi:hypothetical protein
MKTQTTVLVDTNVTTAAHLAIEVEEIREYFRGHQLAQPHLPENVLHFAPCRILITETPTDTGLKIGRLEITKPDRVLLYESEWTMVAARGL